jgi:hypothetical protein
VEISGIADLPLHEGRVPAWIANIMKRLSKSIVKIMLIEFGPEKFLERLVNPLWFQAFNNIIGMDWDSSGSTTVTLGILASVINPIEDDIAILGGKGKRALQIPEQLNNLSKNFNINVDKLKNTSKLVAKVDSTLIQDGYQLYHQSLIVTRSGKWGVIQQGMSIDTKFARRYHWKETNNYVIEPHLAICGNRENNVLNLTKKEVEKARKIITELLNQNPRITIQQYMRAESIIRGQSSLDLWLYGTSITTKIPKYKLIYYRPIDINRVSKVLEDLYQISPTNLEEALLQGLGPSTTRALVLIADLIYNEPPSFDDPVTLPYDPFKYAYAIGGKDGVPYPINRKVAEEVIVTLTDILERAKLEEKDRKFVFKKLKDLASKFKS